MEPTLVEYRFPYQLGRSGIRRDSRNFQFKKLLKEELPSPPTSYDNDAVLGIQDNYMFLNNELGDCVIAARAHMTMRFEAYEQQKPLIIPDQAVKDEYLKESGGIDRGLVMLDSLVQWRQQGWVINGQSYKIHAFAEVDITDHNEVMLAIYLLKGIYVGFQVPLNALRQFEDGKIWDVTNNDGPLKGGHCVYGSKYLKLAGYDEIGPIFMTWGKPQPMTWRAFDKWVDECYAVVDERDAWIDPAENPLKIELLNQYLQQICGTQEPQTPTPPPPPPPPRPHCKFFSLHQQLRRERGLR